MAILFIGAVVLGTPTPATNISFSSGFTDHMVLQRGAMSNVYGFAPTAHPVMVRVLGVDAAGAKVSYVLAATVAPQTAQGFYPRGAPPVHGAFTWRVALRAATGGVYTITANDGSQNASLSDCVIGDVYFCSGQSNMALETFYTFSADTLKAEVRAGKWRNIRHFMFGSMGGQYLATEPQWVSSLQTNDGDPLSTNSWHTLEVSAARPSLNNATGAHSAFAQFSATCMYFAVELVRATGDTTTPIGVIQSAIGGSQIESWMDNTTLTECANESLTGGAVPEDSGRLFYGMVAPFVNTSVSGWLWYQGENNVYGVMGNSVEHVGYACELPAMIKSWRSQWCAPSDAIFGVATLAAGGSEGHDRSMASMRFAQTASYGVLPNALLPRTFVAQVYDLGDPWASVGDGGSDAQNCSKVDPTTGRYGPNCSKWDAAEWSPGVAAYAPLVRKNAPSGVPGNNFMGGIHPRLKRPVGRRLAVAAAALRNGTVLTGPTIAGCSATSVDGATTALTIHFNKTLLGDDAVVVQTRSQYERNASLWKSTDSLGAMVCLGAAAAGPPPTTCIGKCAASGNCCTGPDSADQQPSCAQGCLIAARSASAKSCKAECTRLVNHCEVTYANVTFNMCEAPCAWTPHNPAPPGVDPNADCTSVDAQGCLDACDYYHGAPARPLFPARNETTCACRSWSSVPCDGGHAGTTGQWPCTSAGQNEYWYCVDGPGWKPPRALSARAAALRRSSALEARRLGIEAPQEPANPYSALWQPVALRTVAGAGTASDVVLDLSAPRFAKRVVLAVRYAWALADGTDTCCPESSVSPLGLAPCVPASCPLLTAASQLPANPFFATVSASSGKCACPHPQVCDQ